MRASLFRSIGNQARVLGGAVIPGNHPTSSWAWVLIGLWFGGAPLVMLTLAAVYKLLGKESESDEEES